MGFAIPSWRHVVACITFAYSIDLGTMPHNKY
jgi:hypothetical protein